MFRKVVGHRRVSANEFFRTPFNASSSTLSSAGTTIKYRAAGARAGYYKGGEASVLPSDATLSFDGLVQCTVVVL